MRGDGETNAPRRAGTARLHRYVDRVTDELMAALPRAEHLSPAERRGIIARYTAVLEGNFIYWMTATRLAVASDDARAIVDDNLREEVRDNHPGMLRRFAMAARAYPTDRDALAVHGVLDDVRRFVSRLSGISLLLMMAFFEGFITRFMPYLADLARREGSTEQEYTDVHGTVDVAHTEGLFRALEAELQTVPTSLAATTNILGGVEALRSLIERITQPRAAEHAGLSARFQSEAAA